MDREALIQAGVDVDEALGRVMGNETLLERLLKMFLDDGNFAALQKAIADHDVDGAIAASHALKGTCGNLSMTSLFELATRQLGCLRAGSWDEACALMPQIEESYEKIRGALAAL